MPLVKVSASQLKTSKRCLRKWGFRILDGIPEPQTPAQAQGIAGHAKIEAYLKTGAHPGDDKIGKLIQKAMRPGILPIPGPGLLIEHNFTMPLSSGAEFIGFIDLLVPPDLEGYAGVKDHKFTSSAYWAMTVPDLRDDPQGVSYSKYAIVHWPAAKGVDNTWIYYDHKAGNVLPIMLRRERADVEASWRVLEAEANKLVQIRRLPNARAQDLPGDETLEACRDFKGCPYVDRCDIGKRSRPGTFSGKTFTRGANFSSTTNSSSSDVNNRKGEKQMAKTLQQQLDELLAKKKGQAPATAPATATPVQATAPATAPASPAQATAPATAPVTAPAATAEKPKKKTLAEMQAERGAKGVNPPAPASAAALPTQATPPAVLPPAAPPPVTSVAAAGAVENVPQQVPAGGEASPEPVKKTRAKKEKETAADVFLVLNRAAVMKLPEGMAKPVHLIDLISPIMREVADANKAAHWGMIPYDSKARLAHAFDKWLDETNWKGTLLVDPSTLEAQAVSEVLKHHADFYVWGLS